MNAPVIHLVGQRLTLELAAVARELRDVAVVYHFASTRDLIAAWRLAAKNDAAEWIAPAAVIWLQSRPGEFRQREIDVVAECDPLARPFVVAGCWSEGEPRSGKPLTGATRIYWHQGISAMVPIITRQPPPTLVAPGWVAIHTPQLVDYRGLAAACEALGLQSIWQNDRWPAISSEPALRLFQGWESWQSWRERCGSAQAQQAKEILLLSFPRPADFERAAKCSISRVLAQPFVAADLKSAVASMRKTRICAAMPFVPTAAASSDPSGMRQLQSA